MIAPSCHALQSLLSVVEEAAYTINMFFNTKKPICIVFNPFNRRKIICSKFPEFMLAGCNQEYR